MFTYWTWLERFFIVVARLRDCACRCRRARRDDDDSTRSRRALSPVAANTFLLARCVRVHSAHCWDLGCGVTASTKTEESPDVCVAVLCGERVRMFACLRARSSLRRVHELCARPTRYILFSCVFVCVPQNEYSTYIRKRVHTYILHTF